VVVISNSSPIIALFQIGRLDILRQLQSSILIPPAVAQEVTPTVRNLPGWVVVRHLAQPLRPNRVSASLGAGEHEVISLALELQAERLILDEQLARRLATSLGLRVIGTIGLLLMAKERGLLSKIKPELDSLLKARFFMNQDLYDRVVSQAGE